MGRDGSCPACRGTGWIWDEPPESGEPGDRGVGNYCSCADGEHRKIQDGRFVDQILEFDLDATIEQIEVDWSRQDIDRRKPVKASLRLKDDRRKAV